VLSECLGTEGLSLAQKERITKEESGFTKFEAEKQFDPKIRELKQDKRMLGIKLGGWKMCCKVEPMASG